MVRETRHLQIGNLPDSISESKIVDHFSRYGIVQRVKILGGKCDNLSATVSFIDIKAASKAHNSENRLEERNLWTKYYEPPFSSTSSSSSSSTPTATASSSASQSTPSTNSSNIINSISVNSSNSGSQQQSSLLTPGSDSSSTFKDDRPLAICVRNLPIRSTDSSLKDGLFHEYKKHGKVIMVKVTGQGTDRIAVVCFKKPEDVEKALEVSKNKLFFGCKIEVTPHEGIDAEDNDFRPLEAELDEYHPKATRTLFVGNLEKDITTQELRSHFEIFGEIIEVDIKKQGTSTYAFIQYSDISSVVKGMRKLDGENLGANRIKLGFGKSMPTNCVWLHGISESTSDKCLFRQCSRFGTVVSLTVDRERGKCLVCYDSVDSAQIAVTDLKGRLFNGRRLQVDFASRECQNSFFEKLESSDIFFDTSDMLKVNNANNTSSSSSKKSFSTSSGSVSSKSKTGIGVHGAKETSAIPLKTVDATSSVINRSLIDPRRQSTTTSSTVHLNSLSSSEAPSSSTPTTTGNNSNSIGVTNPSSSNISSSGPSSLESIRSLDDYSTATTTTTSTLSSTAPGIHHPLNNHTLGSLISQQQDVHSTTTRSDEFNSNEVSSSSDKVGSSERGSLSNNSSSNSTTNNNSSRPFDPSGLNNIPDNGTTNLTSFNFPLSLPLPEFATSLRSSLSSSKSSSHHHSSSSSHRNSSTSSSSLSHQQQSSSSSSQPPLSSLSSSFSIQSKDSSQLPQVPHSSPKGNSIMSPLNNLSPSSIQVPKRLRAKSTESKTDCILSTPTTTSYSSINTTTSSTTTSTSLSSLSSSSSSSSSNLNPSATSDTTFNNQIDKLYCSANITSESTKSNPSKDNLHLLNSSGSADTTESLTPSISGNTSKLSSSVSPGLTSPTALSFEDRIKALDEVYIPWSSGAGTGSSSGTVAGKGVGIDNSSSVYSSTPTVDYSKYNIKKKSHVSLATPLNSQRTEPSDIVRSFLSKSSIFDQDSKRLELINEKYEPKETTSTVALASDSSSLKPIFRTKASAKEFSTSIDDKLSSLSSSSSIDSKAHLYHQCSSYLHSDTKSHHHYPPLYTRKLSEPGKLSSVDCKKSGNNTPTTPNTPQSAPARCSSFSPFSTSISLSSLTSSTFTTTTTTASSLTTSTIGASAASSLTCSNLPPTSSSRLGPISSSTSGSSLTASAVSSYSSGTSSSSAAPNLLNRASSCSTSNLPGLSSVSSSTVKKDNIGLNNVTSSSKIDARRLSASTDPRQSNSNKKDNPIPSNQRKEMLSGSSSTTNSSSYTSSYVNSLSHHLETTTNSSINKRLNQHHHHSSSQSSSTSSAPTNYGPNGEPLNRNDLKKTETLFNTAYNRHSFNDDADQDSDNHLSSIGGTNTSSHEPGNNKSSRKGDKTKSHLEKNDSKEPGLIGSSSFLASSSSSSSSSNANNNLHSPTKKHEKERKSSYNSNNGGTADGGSNVSSNKLNVKSRSIGDIPGNKPGKEEKKLSKKNGKLHKGFDLFMHKERVKLKAQSSTSSTPGTHSKERSNNEGKEKSKEKSGIKREKDKDKVKNREKGVKGEKETKGSKEKEKDKDKDRERKSQEDKDREFAEREEKKQLARYRSEMKKLGITDDEPIYFSMYDKVKARSSHNQSLKDQHKDMDTMRQKFVMLKQSRAKKGSRNSDSESGDESDSTSGGGAGSGSGADRSGLEMRRQRTSSISSSSFTTSSTPAAAAGSATTSSSLITSTSSASTAAASSSFSSSLNRLKSKSSSTKKRKLIIESSPSSSDNDDDDHETPSGVPSSTSGSLAKAASLSKRLKKSAPIKPLDSDSDSEFGFEALLASTMKNSAPLSSTHKKTKDLIYSSDSDDEISMASPRYNKPKPSHKLTEDSSDEENTTKSKLPKKFKKDNVGSTHSLSSKQKKMTKESSSEVKVKEEKIHDRSDRHHRDNDRDDSEAGLMRGQMLFKEEKRDGSIASITSTNHAMASSSKWSSLTSSAATTTSGSLHNHKGDSIVSSKDKSEEKLFKKKSKSLKEKDKERSGDHKEVEKSHSGSGFKVRVGGDKDFDGPTGVKRVKEDKIKSKEKLKENKDHPEKVKTHEKKSHEKNHDKPDKNHHDHLLNKLESRSVESGGNKMSTSGSTNHEKSEKSEKKQQQRLQSMSGLNIDDFGETKGKMTNKKKKKKVKSVKTKEKDKKYKERRCSESSVSSREKCSTKFESDYKMESDADLRSDASDFEQSLQRIEKIVSQADCDPEPTNNRGSSVLKYGPENISDKLSSSTTASTVCATSSSSSASSIWDNTHSMGFMKSSGSSKHDDHVSTKSSAYSLDRLSDPYSSSPISASVLSEKSSKANRRINKEVHSNSSGNILNSSSSVDSSSIPLHGKESKEGNEGNVNHHHHHSQNHHCHHGKDGISNKSMETNGIASSGGKKSREKDNSVKSGNNSEVRKRSKKLKDQDRLSSSSSSLSVHNDKESVPSKEREGTHKKASHSSVFLGEDKKLVKEKALEKESTSSSRDKIFGEAKVKLEFPSSSSVNVVEDKIHNEKPVVKKEKEDDDYHHQHQQQQQQQQHHHHHHKVVGSVKRAKSPSPPKKLSNFSSVGDSFAQEKKSASGLGETGEPVNKDKYHLHHQQHSRLSSSGSTREDDDLETREQARLLEKAIFNSHSSEENSVDDFTSLHSTTSNSSSSGLKVGLSKEEKIIRERRFEEEAAIETQRLVEELKSDESWNHFKEPKGLFDELISCSEKENELSKPVLEEKRRILESNIFGAIPSGPEIKVPFPHHLHHPSILNVDPFKVDDVKECEIDDQRKIEDDLAVSALLQEMNVESVPELTTKGPGQYINRIVSPSGPEMGYMVNDEETPLQIAEEPEEGPSAAATPKSSKLDDQNESDAAINSISSINSDACFSSKSNAGVTVSSSFTSPRTAPPSISSKPGKPSKGTIPNSLFGSLSHKSNTSPSAGSFVSSIAASTSVYHSKEAKESVKSVDSNEKFLSSVMKSPEIHKLPQRKIIDNVVDSVSFSTSTITTTTSFTTTIASSTSSTSNVTPVTPTISTTLSVGSRRPSLHENSEQTRKHSEDGKSTLPSVGKTRLAHSVPTTIPSSTTVTSISSSSSSLLPSLSSSSSLKTTISTVTSMTLTAIPTAAPVVSSSSSLSSSASALTTTIPSSSSSSSSVSSSSIVSRRRSSTKSDIESTLYSSEKKKENDITVHQNIPGKESSIKEAISFGTGTNRQEERRPSEASFSSNLFLDSIQNDFNTSENDGCFDDGEEGNEKLVIDETPTVDKALSSSGSPFHPLHPGGKETSRPGKVEIESKTEANKLENRLLVPSFTHQQQQQHRGDNMLSFGAVNDDDFYSRPVFDEAGSDDSTDNNGASKTSKFINENIIDSLLSDSSSKKLQPDNSSNSSEKTELFDDDVPQANEIDSKRASLEEEDEENTSLPDKQVSGKRNLSAESADLDKFDPKVNISLVDLKPGKDEIDSDNEADSESESKSLVFSLSKSSFKSATSNSEPGSHVPNIKIDNAKESTLRSGEDEGKEERDENDERGKSGLERPRRGRRAKTRKYSESSLQLPRYESGGAESGKGKSPGSERPKRHLRGSNHGSEFNSDDQHSLDYESNYLTDEEPSIYFSKHSNDGHIHHDASSQDKSDGRKKRGRRKKTSGNEVPSSKPHEVEIPSKQKERIFLSLSTVSASEKQSGGGEPRKSLSPYDVFEFRDSDEEGPSSLPLESMHSAAQSKIDYKAQHPHPPASSSHHYPQAQPATSSISAISSVIQSTHSSGHQHSHHHSTHSSSSLPSNSSHHGEAAEKKTSDETPSVTATPFFSTSTVPSTTTISSSTSTNTPALTVKSDHNIDTSGKEYVTELSHHGKLSITIRLHPKDGQDGKDGSSTAEVVKTSKALLPDEDKNKDDKDDIANISFNENSSNATNQSSASSLSINLQCNPSVCPGTSSTSLSAAALSGAGVKPTRKSARLMSQANKTTVDEVIEDVVKGIGSCKSDSGKTVKRSTRLSRRADEVHEDDDETTTDSKNDSVDSEGKGESKNAIRTLRITRSVAKGGTTNDSEATSSTSCGKELNTEGNQKRPTLPVLKVELPKLPFSRIIERKTETSATPTTAIATTTVSSSPTTATTSSVPNNSDSNKSEQIPSPPQLVSITPALNAANVSSGNQQHFGAAQSETVIRPLPKPHEQDQAQVQLKSQPEPKDSQPPTQPIGPPSVANVADSEIPKLHPFAKIIDRKPSETKVHFNEPSTPTPTLTPQQAASITCTTATSIAPVTTTTITTASPVPSLPTNVSIVDKVETRLPFSKLLERKTDSINQSLATPTPTPPPTATTATVPQSIEQQQPIQIQQPILHSHPLPVQQQLPQQPLQQQQLKPVPPSSALISPKVSHEENLDLPKVPVLGKMMERKDEPISTPVSLSFLAEQQQHFQPKQPYQSSTPQPPPSLPNLDTQKVPFGKIFDRKPETASYFNEQSHQQLMMQHQKQQQLMQQQQQQQLQHQPNPQLAGQNPTILPTTVSIQPHLQQHPKHRQSSTPVPPQMLSPNVSLVSNVELSKLPYGKLIERKTESSPVPTPSPYLNESQQQQLLLMQRHQQQQQHQQHQQKQQIHQQQQQQLQIHQQIHNQQLLQQQRQSSTPTTPILPPNIAIQHHPQQTKQQPSPTSASSALSPNIPVSDNVDIMYIPSMPPMMRNLPSSSSPGPYLRPPSQPPSSMIVPSHLALHPDAYLRHHQMMYASHAHYSQMHPQVRAQHEAQARAVAMGIPPPRFPYPPAFPLPLISDDKPLPLHPMPYGPPPAHAMSQPGSLHPHPSAHPQTPPHASQVPPQGYLILERYPVLWQGLLTLKNDEAAVRMHFISGNHRIAKSSLPPLATHEQGGTPPVRIAQRMRLEQSQLEVVARKMQMPDEHAILLALPTGSDHMDVLLQSNNLRNGFINYLQSKQAAGIVNSNAPGSQQPAYVIHIFPSCDFSDENLARIDPHLFHSIAEIPHLLILIATV